MPIEKIETALGAIMQPLALQAVNAAGDGGDAGGPPYVVPEWIPLIPAPSGSVNGSLIVGVDGRTFKYEDPEEIIADTRLPIALDYDHGSVMTMWSGKSGEAAARIIQLEMRDDEMWGRCEWTQEGHDAVEKGKYIYISPTFRIRYDYESDDPPEIKFLTSAALTNNPNLNTLPALNQQQLFQPQAVLEARAAPRRAVHIHNTTIRRKAAQPAHR